MRIVHLREASTVTNTIVIAIDEEVEEVINKRTPDF